MTEPKLIDWLEAETGQDLSPTSPVGKTRHVSVRMPDDLYERLENAARQQRSTRSVAPALTSPDAGPAIAPASSQLRRRR